MGAFYPFSRDHSEKYSSRQELYLWNSAANSARKVLGLRYLLPYLYTLVYQAHKIGSPIARPLFFHFYNDPTSLEIDSQFLLRRSILVSPVLTPNTTFVNAYFPQGTWYNLFNYSQIVIHPEYGSYENLSAPLDSINVHVSEGLILPLQASALTTTAAWKTPYKLIVAFSLDPEKQTLDEAEGTLYLDDGENIEMDVDEGKATLINFYASKDKDSYFEVSSSVQEGKFAMENGCVLQTLIVLGTSSLPKSLKVNGIDASESIEVKSLGQFSLEISQVNVHLGKPFIVQWTTAA